MKDSEYNVQIIIENIEKVVIGKRNEIKLLLTALLCNSHVLIEDVPGVGKTTIANALAKSIEGDFKRIQFTPDVMPSDITGFSMYNPKKNSFEYVEGAIMANIILADEINRTPPKTQSSLMEVMSEKQVTVDGKAYELPQPFMVIATQNPVEYLGTYPLPEAQIDRFIMKISLGYPNANEEWAILTTYQKKNPIDELQSVISCEELIKMQKIVREDIEIEESIYDYIIELVGKTRSHPYVQLGASPRASLHLSLASRAMAYMNKRSYVLPDDVRFLAQNVLVHRLVLHQEAKLKKVTSAQIISEIIKDTSMPVVKKR